MADEIENEEKETSDEATDPPTRGGGRSLMLAFVSVVVLLETAMFFFLVPSADEVSALAEARLISSVQQDEDADNEQAVEKDLVKEFNLGMYGETFSPRETESLRCPESNGMPCCGNESSCFDSQSQSFPIDFSRTFTR